MPAGGERPIRVLHLNTQVRLRGGESQTIALAAALRAGGHVSSLVCQPGSPVERAARAEAVPVLPVRMRADADPLAVGAIAAHLRRGRYDVVHAHTSHAVGLAALAAPFGGRPARVHTRRIARTILRPGSFRLNRWKYLLGTDVCIGISRAVTDQLERDGLPGERLALVPSGVDLPTNGARLRGPELGLPRGAPVLGNVSYLEDEKGVDILIDAMRIVAERHPKAILLLVGDGPEMGALRERARLHRLGDRVRFLGHRRDARALLPLFDIYVAPSRREALGTSILSAQAHGVAVVASHVGGIPEVIRDGETGILTPPGAPGPLAESVLRLLRDGALRRRLGRAGRDRVAGEFSTERMVSGTIEVYRRVLRRRRAGRGER